jgi:tRNA A37 methylthiotransferase MiaB
MFPNKGRYVMQLDMNSIKKVCVTTPFGCTKRGLDAARLIQYFKLNNCQVITKPKEADCIILITCSFKRNREIASLREVNRLKRFKGELIVCGCLPGASPGKLKLQFNGKSISIKDLPDIDKFFVNLKIRFIDIPDQNLPFYSLHKPWFTKTDVLSSFIQSPRKLMRLYFCKLFKRAVCLIKDNAVKELPEVHLRIGTGCSGNCSYCAIRGAIGRFKSKPVNDCLKEYRELLEKDFRQFVINAEDVGAYGIDLNSSFGGLLEKLSNIDEHYTVNWDIRDLSAGSAIKHAPILINYLRNGKINRITCGIQSGSARILRLMNRYHNIEEIERVLVAFKKANPSLLMFSAFIIGFPSETAEDFIATIDLIKRIRPDFVNLHAYSNMEGAVAHKINDKVELKTILKRLKTAVHILGKEKICCGADDLYSS